MWKAGRAGIGHEENAEMPKRAGLRGFQRGLDGVAGGAEDMQAGVAFVVGGDEVPARGGGVGEGEHVADRDLVAGPFAAVAPVLLVDLVLLEVGLFAGAEAGELFLAADVELELDHDLAVVGEFAFKVL